MWKVNEDTEEMLVVVIFPLKANRKEVLHLKVLLVSMKAMYL